MDLYRKFLVYIIHRAAGIGFINRCSSMCYDRFDEERVKLLLADT